MVFSRNLFILLFLSLSVGEAQALTANKVWFEFTKRVYRVRVQYTVPELKELKEAYAEFRDKKKAERAYFDLLRGADFYLGKSLKTGELLIQFTPPVLGQDPW
ncbi:MAG: hypothetical protein KA436_03890 [Oligoflexales bacterium]|nr:hypothetical protein [Oligoflexales bacterium]